MFDDLTTEIQIDNRLFYSQERQSLEEWANDGGAVATDEELNLKCTSDHKLLTPTGWVELQNLNVGDRIASVFY